MEMGGKIQHDLYIHKRIRIKKTVYLYLVVAVDTED
jgi:hypothetical protein